MDSVLIVSTQQLRKDHIVQDHATSVEIILENDDPVIGFSILQFHLEESLMNTLPKSFIFNKELIKRL